MPYFEFQWNDKNKDHIDEHGISQDEFEAVVCDPERTGKSKASGLPAAWGYMSDGRYIMAVYDYLDELTVLPVTAFEVPEP
jgi:hypothetical protein